jgi:hypothetical protein
MSLLGVGQLHMFPYEKENADILWMTPFLEFSYMLSAKDEYSVKIRPKSR